MSTLRRPSAAIPALLLVVALLAALVPLPVRAAAQAQEDQATISGTLVHGGGLEGFDPSAVTVDLSVLEGVTVVQQQSVRPDASGAFQFRVTPRQGRTYFLNVVYQGAAYSTSRNITNLEQPVTIEVFEATSDPSVISFESYTIIVTGAARRQGFVEVEERVTVRNDSGMTLVPSMTGDAPMLSFLRFGLPAGYHNLDVASSLVGGTVLDVPEGFAVDMPVPPTIDGPHEFRFVYRVSYDSPEVDLSRTMRFGAETLRIIVPADVANPSVPDLQYLGAAELNGRLLRLFEGSVEPGTPLALSISGLPMPTFWDRFSASAGDWYMRAIVPGMMAVLGAALLVIGYKRRPFAYRTAEALPPDARRQLLLDRLAELEDDHNAGVISHDRYRTEREQLRRLLVEAEMRRRLRLDQT